MVRKRFWLITLVAVFVFVAAGVGTYFWAKYRPSYRATAALQVLAPTPPQAMKQVVNITNKDIMLQVINTHAARITSLDTLSAVLKDPAVRQTRWYNSFDNKTDEILLDLQSRVTAVPERDSALLRVSFTCGDAEEARDIVNALVDIYYNKVKAESQQKAAEERSQYQKRQQDLEAKLNQKNKEHEQYRVSRQIPLLQNRQERIGQQVTNVELLLAEAATRKDEAQSLYELYNQPNAMARVAETPEMRQLIESDSFVRVYTTQLSDLKVALEAARDRGPKHRSVTEVERRIAQVEKELNARRAQLIQDNFKNMQERTRVQLDAATSQVVGLQERLAEAKAEIADLENKMAAYLEQEKEIDALRTQLAEITDHLFKLGIQSEDPELVRITKAAMAAKPLKRSLPSWPVNLAFGLVMGVMLGVGLAFLVELASTTVRTPADIVRQLRLPLLGNIPSQEDDEASPADMHRVLIDSPQSILAESFRQLRTNFLFSGPPELQRTVGVTSCAPGEGKTCIAVNLATSLALTGRKVLLVDANFRRPGVSEAFGQKGAKDGLSNAIVGQADIQALIKPSPHQNLDLLPAGPLPPNPAELIGQPGFKALLDHLGRTYQTIFLDGPPILVVSDAQVLATVVDGVLFVVRAGFCNRGRVTRARDQLSKLGAHLLGVVLNDVRVTRGGYFREVYRTYYEYQVPTGTDE